MVGLMRKEVFVSVLKQVHLRVIQFRISLHMDFAVKFTNVAHPEEAKKSARTKGLNIAAG